MIRTHAIPCKLPRDIADLLNRASGAIYTGVLVAHWRVRRRKDRWLSQTSGTRWSDGRGTAAMHAHSIDAAQQGFYKACVTTRALRNAGFQVFDLVEPCYYDGSLWQVDVILLRGDLHRKFFRDIGKDFDPARYVMFTD